MQHLEFLRDEFSDEIPAEIIHSDALNNRFKVRVGWFQGVVATAWNLLSEGQISGNRQQAAAQRLVDKFTSQEFVDQDLTTRRDITVANRLIDIILGRR